MDKARKRLIHLHHLRSVTRKTLEKMLELDSTLQKIYQLTPQELGHQLAITPKRATAIYNEVRDLEYYKTIRQHLNGITVVTIFDQIYPKMLKHIYDPPHVLYCLGNIKLLQNEPSISVIGTRKPSNEAPQKLHFILAPLIHHQYTIVSGLAYGIDKYAHELTLKYGGKTIAVLGSGFHHLYPTAHEHIFNEIIEKGLVITEYPPHIQAKRYHFPERNRIVSGLSRATLVIEAEERSGTNITVDHALEQGREVYAVPGSILNSQTVGCHKMIQQGAKLVMHANDIIEDYEQLSFFE